MQGSWSETPELILASASPRRRQLLRDLGCDFKVEIADVDETRLPNELPLEYVSRVAHSKASTIQSSHPACAILAADTIVVCDEQLFGKPRNQQQAFEMWLRLSGCDHQVMSAVCLLFNGMAESLTVTTKVRFAELSDAEMLRYWKSGEPQDKAGGYAIQGLGSAWVQQVHGSYSNVVGLPLFETNHLLRLVGHNWL